MYEVGDVVMVPASAVPKRHTSASEEATAAAVVVSRALEATVQVTYDLRIIRSGVCISGIDSSLLEPCWWTATERRQRGLPSSSSYLR